MKMWNRAQYQIQQTEGYYYMKQLFYKESLLFFFFWTSSCLFQAYKSPNYRPYKLLIMREGDKKNFERKVTQRNGYERGCKKIMKTG